MKSQFANAHPVSSKAGLDTDPRLRRARDLLDDREHTLTELATKVGLSASHLQRRFRQAFGLSPAEYAAQRRLRALKQALRAGDEVSGALYDAGYGSPSRVYEHGAARIGMTPASYRRGGRGEQIRWSLIDTALGVALVAATARGICMIELGAVDAGSDPTGATDAGSAGGSSVKADTRTTLLAMKLRAEFPHASLQRVDAGRDTFLAPRVRAVADALAGIATGDGTAAVTVDLIGTAFQKRVWDALMKIPSGQTCSYAELASALDAPKSARAVAGACARNRVAIVVPCHRVIRGDGSPGGYRWGLPLKQQLLRRERAA